MNFDKLFDIAKKRGVEAIQVYLEENEQVELAVFKGELEKNQMAKTHSLNIKGIYKGKMGQMTTEVIDLNQVDEWVEAIIKSATLIESKDEVFIYPGDDDYPKVDGLYQAQLNETPIEDKIQLAFDLEAKMAQADSRIEISQSFYNEATKRVVIQNSKGLNLEKRVNNAFIGGQVVARSEGDSRSAFDYTQSNLLSDFDLDSIAQKMVDKAVSLLGAKALKSSPYEIVLTNEASASLLQAYVSMFSAESVQKGMSKLSDKIGQVIASPLISIVDDPFLAKSPRSGAFDDEGVKTQYQELISEGKLESYMHNLKTAKKANASSTGNGFRGSVSPTNFYIKEGKSNYEDLVKTMKKGLIIADLQGTHSGTNAISGDFSLQASGYYVENGEIIKPVALITVAGNYLTMLQDVEAVGNDMKYAFNFIGSPSLKIKSLAVSGE